MGIRPEGSPHSAWELLEHIRLALRDILEFSKSAKYKPRKWPDDYWPRNLPSLRAPRRGRNPSKAILSGSRRVHQTAQRSKRDLYEPFPWGDGQTLLREALLIADHNAYHVGEIVLLRRLLGAWPN